MLATTILVVVLPGFVSATWKNVKLASGYGCQDSDSGAVITYPDLPYKDSANVTKSCNTLNLALTWLRHSAAAAVIRTHTLTNPDGTQDTTYPQDNKPPTTPVFTWACDTQMATIANQNTGTATSINVDSCASGTGVSSAVYSFVKSSDGTSCSTDWSITGSYPNRTLANSGTNAGSGTCKLKAVVASGITLSTSYPWSYTAPGDTTAPNPVTGTTGSALDTTHITLTFDSTVDPADGVATSGVKVYHFYRNGVLLTGQDLTASNPGMVNDFTPTAIGTASGSATQTGASWALSGNGGLGVEGTADGINALATPVNGSSFDIIFGVSSIQNAGTDNKAGAEFRASNNSDSVANNCTFDLASGILFTNSRNRTTTGGTRSSDGQVATQFSASMPAHAYLKNHYDANGLSCYASSDGGAWTQTVDSYALASLPAAKSAIVFATANNNGTSINVTYDFVSVNNVGRLTKTLTVPQSSATYTVTAEDFAGNVSTALAGWTGAPDTPSAAVKTQPGWYAAYNKQCIPKTGIYGCSAADLVSAINTEICPNSNLVGMKIWALPSFLMADTEGVYTASDRGFAIIDQVLTALNACGKYLILRMNATIFGDPSNTILYYPAFTFPSSYSSGGTAAAGVYGIQVNTQPSQPGQTAKLWDTDWRDLMIAAAAAYCNRYDSNPAFYAFGMGYANVSIPMASGDYPVAQFNTYYRTYLASAKASCAHTNVMALLDFTTPYPQEMSTYLSSMVTSHASVENSDVLPDGATWGQEVYTGTTGSPSVVDYRGVVRYFEEVESVEMCGYKGTNSPATLFGVMQNGNTGNRPRWPSHIVITMANECDSAGTGWAAWKTFIASKSGMVMNGRDSTLRTPATVKASYCETSLTCQ